MSRLPNSISPGASKQLIKKKQAQIKTLVGTFGSMTRMWLNDVQQVAILLNQLENQISKAASIVRAYSKRIEIVDWSHGNSNAYFKPSICLPNMIDEQVIKSLLFSISRDIDATCAQIRSFEKRLKDTILAMLMTSEECSRLSLNEGIGVFDAPTCIFTTNHAIDIVRLQKMFALEYERKLALLRSFGLLHQASVASDMTNAVARNSAVVVDNVDDDDVDDDTAVLQSPVQRYDEVGCGDNGHKVIRLSVGVGVGVEELRACGAMWMGAESMTEAEATSRVAAQSYPYPSFAAQPYPYPSFAVAVATHLQQFSAAHVSVLASDWSDACAASHLNEAAVQEFLLRNNI